MRFAGEKWEPAQPSASLLSSAGAKAPFVATWLSSGEGLGDGEGKTLHVVP